MSSRFLVTGAAGGIGLALLEQLSFEGKQVLALDLVPGQVNFPGVTWITGDILEPDSYASRMAGVDTVIHLAAKVHVIPRTVEEAKEFHRVNVDGTRSVLNVSAHAGVQRFVFISTVSVLSPFRGYISDAYAESKRDAEKSVFVFQDCMEIVVVRPTTVYGPNDRGNVYRLIRWIDKGLPPIIGKGTNKKSMVFVRNLAEAIYFISEHGASGGSYVVTDGVDYSMLEVVDRICRSLGRRNRWRPIPISIARVLARVSGPLSRCIGFKNPIDDLMIDKATEETVFDASLLLSIGFSPPYSFEEGIEETVRWYKHSAQSRSV
jgi:nucleoside-diphosphate-sugar epimerase